MPPGAPPRPRPQPRTDVTGHKLFFALRPDEAVAERIACVVAAEHVARGLAPRLRPARIFHITLHYFGYCEGEPDDALLARAGEAAAEVVQPAFDVSFDSFASWGDEQARKHPFVLTGGEGLQAARQLHEALSERLAAHGLADPEPGRRYQPHLTLRYDKRPAPAWPVDVAGWFARAFVLVKSPQGLTRHDVIGHWPLRG